ncbi:MAG: hypothetical protein JWL65_1641 [Gammaproteobacteria bacterium]|nr:hypothetical protein [Gammaproteobacteria bacterium]
MTAATMKIVARVQTMTPRLFWTLFIRPHPVAGVPGTGGMMTKTAVYGKCGRDL